jgi:hypothetical protein
MAEEKSQVKPASPAPAPAPSPELDALEKVLAMPEDQVFPWEEVVLPSEGYYYDNAVPGGRVQVRPMGIFADKILATQRLAQSGQSLDWLFRKCVKFPVGDFNPLNLLAGDRIFLLYYLRGITHGNNYEFIVRCTNEDCGQTHTSEYDLNQLQRTIIKPKYSLGTEPFKIVLPHMSKLSKTDFWVKVRLLRGYDMQQMLTGRKVFKKIQATGRNASDKNFIANSEVDTDQTLEDNLNMLIIEAMGSTDKVKIKNLVSKLHSSDTATIREFIKDNSPGIDTAIAVTCPSCSQEMRMELPITESFFRPKAAGNS